MKLFSRVLLWTVGLALAFSYASITLIQADPTDDFTFSLARASDVELYRLMPESRVVELFQDRLAPVLGPGQAERLAGHLLSLCRRYRFDPAFVLSLIEVESQFRVRVVSPMGAVGLMQVMPALMGNRVAATHALMDPFTNLSVGMAYLARLRDRYRRLSPYYLVAAYNIGPGKMDHLLARPSFKPVKTKRYYEAIRREVPQLRFYGRASHLN